MIVVTLVLTVIFNFAFAAYMYFVRSSIVIVVLFILFAVLYAVCAWSWRHHIPFAAIMLSTVSSVTQRYHGTIISSIIMSVVQAATQSWILLTVRLQ
jgi:uncharacterized membrane protein affecting hemolysin expression